MNVVARLSALRPLFIALPLLQACSGASNSPETTATVVDAPGSSSDISGIWLNPYGAHRMGDPENPKLVRPPIPVAKLTPHYQRLTDAQTAVWMNSQVPGKESVLPADSTIVKRQILCLPYGMPTDMAYNMSFDIHQAKDRITIVGELDRAVRRIWMDREQLPPSEVESSFYGRSVGKWEGNTLLVNTVGIRPDVYGENFMAHSDQMQITERIWLQEPDILHNEITIVDPLALQEPFKYLVILTRAPTDYEPSEFICDQYPTHMVGPDGRLTISTHMFNR
jgi:hypothetical protein